MPNQYTSVDTKSGLEFFISNAENSFGLEQPVALQLQRLHDFLNHRLPEDPDIPFSATAVEDPPLFANNLNRRLQEKIATIIKSEGILPETVDWIRATDAVILEAEFSRGALYGSIRKSGFRLRGLYKLLRGLYWLPKKFDRNLFDTFGESYAVLRNRLAQEFLRRNWLNYFKTRLITKEDLEKLNQMLLLGQTSQSQGETEAKRVEVERKAVLDALQGVKRKLISIKNDDSIAEEISKGKKVKDWAEKAIGLLEYSIAKLTTKKPVPDEIREKLLEALSAIFAKNSLFILRNIIGRFAVNYCRICTFFVGYPTKETGEIAIGVVKFEINSSDRQHQGIEVKFSPNIACKVRGTLGKILQKNLKKMRRGNTKGH